MRLVKTAAPVGKVALEMALPRQVMVGKAALVDLLLRTHLPAMAVSVGLAVTVEMANPVVMAVQAAMGVMVATAPVEMVVAGVPVEMVATGVTVEMVDPAVLEAPASLVAKAVKVAKADPDRKDLVYLGQKALMDQAAVLVDPEALEHPVGRADLADPEHLADLVEVVCLVMMATITLPCKPLAMCSLQVLAVH